MPPPNEILENCRAILEVNQGLKEFCSEQNITLVDSYNSLTNGTECYINKLLFMDYVHLNKKGNSLVAELISKQAFNKTSLEAYSEKPNFLKRILKWLGFEF